MEASNIMKYKGYSAALKYSKSDGLFYGKIANIKDLVNFEGKNKKKAKVAFQEVVDVYIKFCSEIGKK